jgi:hypothetical protein
VTPHSTIWFAAAVSIAGLTFGGCGLFRPSITLTPVALTRVDYERGAGAPILRIDFYSQPELLAEDRAIISASARFCDSSDSGPLAASPVLADGEDITWRRPPADDAGRVMYSIQVDTGEPWSPGRHDFVNQPRPLCAWLDLFVPYDMFTRTSNVMEFSTEQVGAAARISPRGPQEKRRP